MAVLNGLAIMVNMCINVIESRDARFNLFCFYIGLSTTLVILLMVLFSIPLSLKRRKIYGNCCILFFLRTCQARCRGIYFLHFGWPLYFQIKVTLEFASVSYILIFLDMCGLHKGRIKFMWTAMKCNLFFSNIAKISNFSGRKILENKHL